MRAVQVDARLEAVAGPPTIALFTPGTVLVPVWGQFAPSTLVTVASTVPGGAGATILTDLRGTGSSRSIAFDRSTGNAYGRLVNAGGTTSFADGQGTQWGSVAVATRYPGSPGSMLREDEWGPAGHLTASSVPSGSGGLVNATGFQLGSPSTGCTPRAAVLYPRELSDTELGAVVAWLGRRFGMLLM